MKLTREHMNEKFTEDSDPIKDLGIGMLHQIKLWMKSIGEPFENKDEVLRFCSLYGKSDFVKYLLNAGADVHADNNGALQWASKYGHTEVVKLLLNAGANVHANIDYALRWASENGHTDVVKLLLNAGANVHAEDDDALQWASHNGHTEVVKILKDHIDKEKKKEMRENLNEKFTEDSDPIDDLGIGLRQQVDQYICKELHLCDKSAINNFSFASGIQGYSAILVQLIYIKKIEIAPYLLKLKLCDVRIKKSIALRWAVARGYYALTKMLIKYGANPNDSDKGNSLDVSMTHRQEKMMKYLLKIGVTITDHNITHAKNAFSKSNPNLIKEMIYLKNKQKK